MIEMTASITGDDVDMSSRYIGLIPRSNLWLLALLGIENMIIHHYKLICLYICTVIKILNKIACV